MKLKDLFDTKKYIRPEEKISHIPSFLHVSKDVIKIVWASMIETLLGSLVTLFDGIQVAQIGNEANAAVTICKQPYFILVCLVASLNIAITAVVARRRGEQDVENANKTMHLGIVLSFMLAVILSITFVLLSGPVVLLMQAKEDTYELAKTYFSILSAGFIFNALMMTINACQKGVGHTQISMLSNMIANGVNIFLNYCLIGGHFGLPALGIKGAAIATIIGQFFGFIASLISVLIQKDYVKFRLNRLFSWDKLTFLPLWQLIPSVLIEQLLMRIGFILFAIIVNGLGTVDTYIQGVCNDINSLLFSLADGFAIGTSAIVGHKLGERRPDLAIVYAKVAMIISVTCGIIICSLMITFRSAMISLYKPDSTYKYQTCMNVLYLAAAACVFQNIQWVNTGILRVAGDSRFTACTSLLSIVIVRPLVSLLLIYVMFTHKDFEGNTVQGLGVYGAWIAQFIDQAMRMTLNLKRFSSRKWTHIKL